jgi:hypothetical protein
MLFSATSSGPKTSCSLLSSRNGNHAAGFVGDECDDPVRGGAMVSHAPTNSDAPWPPRRRSSTRAVWRVCHSQIKKKGEVFRRHTFPPFWLTNSKLTKSAAAAGGASRSVISIPRARSSFCCIRSGIHGGRSATGLGPLPIGSLYADSALQSWPDFLQCSRLWQGAALVLS